MDGEPHSFVSASFPKCIRNSTYVSSVTPVTRTITSTAEETHLYCINDPISKKPLNNISIKSEKQGERSHILNTSQEPEPLLIHCFAKHMQEMFNKLASTYLALKLFYTSVWAEHGCCNYQEQGFQAKLKLCFSTVFNRNKMTKTQGKMRW
jgi:hypothetical protein